METAADACSGGWSHPLLLTLVLYIKATRAFSTLRLVVSNLERSFASLLVTTKVHSEGYDYSRKRTLYRSVPQIGHI